MRSLNGTSCFTFSFFLFFGERLRVEWVSKCERLLGRSLMKWKIWNFNFLLSSSFSSLANHGCTCVHMNIIVILSNGFRQRMIMMRRKKKKKKIQSEREKRIKFTMHMNEMSFWENASAGYFLYCSLGTFFLPPLT